MVYTNSSATRTFSADSSVETLTNYIVATTNATTDPAVGKAINNEDGSLTALSAVLRVTSGAGTNPKATLQLQGTNGNPASSPTWVQVKGTRGTDVVVASANIATATTNAVVFSLASTAFGMTSFPFKHLRFINDLKGTSPGWSGTMNVVAQRQKRKFI